MKNRTKGLNRGFIGDLQTEALHNQGKRSTQNILFRFKRTKDYDHKNIQITVTAQEGAFNIGEYSATKSI